MNARTFIFSVVLFLTFFESYDVSDKTSLKFFKYLNIFFPEIPGKAITFLKVE